MLPEFSQSQSCFQTGFQGSIKQYVCPQACSDISFRIPHIRSIDHYTVISLPYQPYPWTNPTGTELTEIYSDDRYSSAIPLPFPFCFCASVYHSVVVGSNGVITFDVSQANLVNAWSLTTVPHSNIPQPIPYAGGTPNTTASTYYPRASVMGPYHDMFPLLDGGGSRKIEYYVTGTAPCRKFVISYYRVPLYGSAACNQLLSTHQIVLHETTGIIDVHIENKPVCHVWNSGLAILGIQNWSRDSAVWAPGKNASVWSESASSYRFIPSGNGSRFVKSEMFTLNGTFIAAADTATVISGTLDLIFRNICPPPDTTAFLVKTTFSSCHNPSLQMINTDTIRTICDNNLRATASSTNSDCHPSGTITVTVPQESGTPPFTYVLNNGTPVVAGHTYTFTNVSHGQHTVVVNDANNACTSTLTVQVGRNHALQTQITSTNAYCAGSAAGTITVNVLNGTPPYLYTLNGGVFVSGGATHTFSGLTAGTHTIMVEDSTGCKTNLIHVNIQNGPGVTATATTTAATCPGVSNGSIRVTAVSAYPPFSFRLNGGAPQSGNNPFTFHNVPSGTHTVTVTDSVNCQFTFSVTVPSGPALTANHLAMPTSCNGAADGKIIITPQNGVAPYRFSLNGNTPVSGTIPFVFSNLPSGLHSFQVFDSAGCESIVYQVMILPGPPLQASVDKTDVLCYGDSTVRIVVQQPANGQPPYFYSLDNVNWQSHGTFSRLPAGSYTVHIRSQNQCTGSVSVTILQPEELRATITTTPVKCHGENNGIIRVEAAGGKPPYRFSLNGGVSWQSQNVFQVGAGNYTIFIQDSHQCIITKIAQVSQPARLTATSQNQNATCDGGDDGRISVVAVGGNGGYRYSLNGNTFQSSNVFQTGPGTFLIHVKDSLGCETSFTTTVGLTFNLRIELEDEINLCEGASVQLQPGSNATSFRWEPEQYLSHTSISNPVASPPHNMKYYLTATLGRCTLTDSVRINVNKAPVPDAGPDGEICYGKSYTLQGSGGVYYEWTPATYLNSTMVSHPVSTPSVSTTYRLKVRDAHGCQSLTSDEVNVVVKRIMAVTTIPFDTVISPGQSIPALAISAGKHYKWVPAAGVSNPDISNPVITPAGNIGDKITYQVTATDTNGCKGEGYVHIRIHKGPAVYLPNAFTPNGDGKNDIFIPHYVGIKQIHQFKVFNRWGQEVFSTRNLQDGWDGNRLGLPQPSGTYVWMVEAVTSDNQKIFRKGIVTLIR